MPRRFAAPLPYVPVGEATWSIHMRGAALAVPLSTAAAATAAMMLSTGFIWEALLFR